MLKVYKMRQDVFCDNIASHPYSWVINVFVYLWLCLLNNIHIQSIIIKPTLLWLLWACDLVLVGMDSVDTRRVKKKEKKVVTEISNSVSVFIFCVYYIVLQSWYRWKFILSFMQRQFIWLCIVLKISMHSIHSYLRLLIQISFVWIPGNFAKRPYRFPMIYPCFDGVKVHLYFLS